MKTGFSRLPILAVIAISFLIQSYGFHRPWSEKDVGYNGAFYSILARNYVRYGFLQTKWGPVRNTGKADPAEFTYYLNHPPLLSILVSCSFKLFGVNEGSARLVPLLFTFLSLWIFSLLSRALWGHEAAVIATAVAAFLPTTLFYGAHVEVFGPLLLFFVLLTIHGYWKWLETDRKSYLCLSAAAFCLGTFVEWDIYLLSLLLPLHAILSKRHRPSSRKIFILPLLALCCLALFFFHATLLFGSAHAKEFGKALLYRQRLETVTTASAAMTPGQTIRFPHALKPAGDYLNWVLFGYLLPEAAAQKPNLLDYLLRNLLYLLIYFNPLTVFLACLGLGQRAVRASPLAKNLLFSVLLLGFFRILFFHNETWEHRYIYFLLIPGLCWAAALGFKALFPLKGFRKHAAYGAVFLFLLTSAGATWKLHQLNSDFSGKSLGELIRRYTAFEEKAMTSSAYSYQALYYADRRIFFDVTTWERFTALRKKSGESACFLLAKGGSVEPKLLEYLKTHYTSRRIEGATLFGQPSRLGVSSQTR